MRFCAGCLTKKKEKIPVSFFGTSFGTGARQEFTLCERAGVSDLEWKHLSEGGQPPSPQISISHDWSYASHVWINILCLGGLRGGEEERWAKLGCCLFRILWKYEGKFAILLVFHNYMTCMRAVYIRCVQGVNSFMSECVCMCVRAHAHACSGVCWAAPVTFSPQASTCKPLRQLQPPQSNILHAHVNNSQNPFCGCHRSFTIDISLNSRGRKGGTVISTASCVGANFWNNKSI